MEKKELEERWAVALSYDPKKGSPEVLAKGRGLLAELILKIAREHNIPIREDDKLVRELYKLELNKPIPTELYYAVAAVLAWAVRLNKRLYEKIVGKLQEEK